MLGWTEILVVGSVVVLFFGWRKFPDLAKSVGASIGAFKKELKDNTRDVEEIKKPDEPE